MRFRLGEIRIEIQARPDDKRSLALLIVWGSQHHSRKW